MMTAWLTKMIRSVGMQLRSVFLFPLRDDGFGLASALLGSRLTRLRLGFGLAWWCLASAWRGFSLGLASASIWRGSSFASAWFWFVEDPSAQPRSQPDQEILVEVATGFSTPRPRRLPAKASASHQRRIHCAGHRSAADRRSQAQSQKHRRRVSSSLQGSR